MGIEEDLTGRRARSEFDDSLARSCWDDSADAWNHFVESGLDYYRSDLHGPALLAACTPVRGLDALDLGCGQGWFSRQLARQGAHVVGVDWSQGAIAHARRHEAGEPLGAIYEVMDAALVAERFDPASFDLITGCMSIMDMPKPKEVLAAALPLLRERGRLIFSISHPVTDSTYRDWERDENGRQLALKIDRYFEAAPSILEWSMKRLPQPFRTVQYRHTLEQWSRMIEDAGFAIVRLREPRPSAEALARCPDLEDANRVPFFLILELRAN